MKKYLFAALAVAMIYCNASAQKGFAHQKFTIMVANSTLFDLHADPLPDDGQGYFMKYTTPLKKGKSFEYQCENPNALKGVEGHLKFRANNNEITGGIDIYFDNPAVGSMKYNVTADWPYAVTQVIPFAEKRTINLWIEITSDTANHGPRAPSGVKVSPASGTDEPIPDIIQFDWQVTQRLHKDEDDEKNGKAYRQVTYFFTSGGDYAAVKPEDKSFSLMIYSKKGHTWLFDDEKKIITVMNMRKTVGEGAAMGRAMTEGTGRPPAHGNKDDETFTVTKTGKTKNILGYAAEEYELRNNKVLTTKSTNKTGTSSFWYIKAPFDPVKIYTMGAGRPADPGKLQNDPRMKNNITAVPVLNKNYLWAEMESGGIKGMETTEIKHVYNTIRTTGYKIKVMNGLKDMLKGDDDN